MGFDAVDRKFRPKEIKPECEECHTTAKVSNHGTKEYPRLLCDDCWNREMYRGYVG